MKRPRSAATRLGLAATVLLTVTGCASLTSPATIIDPYDAADGATTRLAGSSLTLADFVVVGAAQGQPAEVVGSVINGGASPADVSLTAKLAGGAQPEATTVTVPGNSSVLIGPDQSTTMAVPELPVMPGAQMTLTASTSAAGSSDVTVPVLRPVGYYAGLTPSPTPSASKRVPHSKSAVETPTPTETSTPTP